VAESRTRYDDSTVLAAAANTEKELGLPSGLLASIITRGEKSNSDQVSEAGARGVAQIIPATRNSAIKLWGIDPYLSTDNSVKVAGLLLKDSLARNNGDIPSAIGEYHGGVNRDNWGPINRAYVGRVMTGLKKAESDQADALGKSFDDWLAKNPAVVPVTSPTQAAPSQAGKPSDALLQGFDAWVASEGGPKAGAGTLIPPEPGLIDRVKEAFTGAGRETRATQELPEIQNSGVLSGLDISPAQMAKFSALLAVTPNAAEVGSMAKQLSPELAVAEDEKGNLILANNKTGVQAVINKPGLSALDVAQGVGIGAAFSPAGRATSLLGMAGKAGLTQAAIEGSQAASGGEFNPGDIAASAALAPALPAAANLVRAGGGLARQIATRVMGKPEPSLAAAPAALPSGQTIAPSAPAIPAPELAQTAKTAAGGGLGAKAATQTLAEQAAPDLKVVEAAKRLGIEDYLQPDHVTTNQAYRELAQAVKSVPGSEARSAEIAGLEKVGERASSLVEEIGGTRDLSALDASVKTRLQTTVNSLTKNADDLYTQVRAAIPAKTTAPATETLAFLKQHADEVGGAVNLAPVERKLLASLEQTGRPLTYAYLDQTRKQIGQAMRKATGPFADSESGMLKKLYGTLSSDQQAVADSVGAGDLYRAAAASVAVRKGVEDDMASLFGKELSGSLTGNLAGAVRALTKGDASKLTKMLAAVPDDMRQEVAASGLATAFRTAGTQGPINFGTFTKMYERLLENKQSYAALMSNLPQPARKQISDLYRVSKAISSASRERITTGRIMAVQDEFKAADSLAGRLYETAKRGAVGAAAGTVVGAVAGPGAGAAVASALTKGAKPQAIKAVDALITSPEFIAATRSATGSPAAVRKLAYSKMFSNFVRALGNPPAMQDRERWIAQAMQGVRAENTGRPESFSN